MGCSEKINIGKKCGKGRGGCGGQQDFSEEENLNCTDNRFLNSIQEKVCGIFTYILILELMVSSVNRIYVDRRVKRIFSFIRLYIRWWLE